MVKDSANIELIPVNGFKILYFKTNPPRMEAKVIFDRDNISQRLIFTLMNITHAHGLGCSAPTFKGIDDPAMTFLIGTILPSARSKKKYVEKLHACLLDIQEFSQLFIEQLDFSRLDLTMFADLDVDAFYPEQLAAIRDQHYGGSWEKFFKAMQEEQRFEEAEVVEKCHEFEKINGKDIGLVGHKLNYMLNMLEEGLGSNFEIN